MIERTTINGRVMHPNDQAMLDMWADALGKRLNRRDHRIGDLWQAELAAMWLEWLILIIKVQQGIPICKN